MRTAHPRRLSVTLVTLWLVSSHVLARGAHAQSEPVAERPVHTPPVLDSTMVVDSAVAPPAGGGCWRARPRPHCAGFILTDFGVEVPVRSARFRATDGSMQREFATRLVWTFGVMGNAGRYSHGGALSFTAGTTTDGIGSIVEYRIRNWLSRSAAVDAALGYESADVWNPGAGWARGRGLTAMLAFTPTRFVGLSARGSLLRSRGTSHSALLLGVQSTRASEFIVRAVFITIVRELLGKIGIELEED